MHRLKPIAASVLTMTLLVLNCSAKNLSPQEPSSSVSSQREILAACRDALIDLRRAREIEASLREKVTELEALVAAGKERIDHLEAAITKYESAIAARTQAEALVSELRSNYEKQVALAEKQLAIEQGKTNFWRAMARVGIVAGLAIGAVLGYAIGNR